MDTMVYRMHGSHSISLFCLVHRLPDYSGADKESVDVDRTGKPDTDTARFELGFTMFILDWSSSIHGGEDSLSQHLDMGTSMEMRGFALV